MEILDFCDSIDTDFRYYHLQESQLSPRVKNRCSRKWFYYIKANCMSWKRFQSIVPFLLCTHIKYGYELRFFLINCGIKSIHVHQLVQQLSGCEDIMVFYNSNLSKNCPRAYFFSCMDVLYVLGENYVREYRNNHIHVRMGVVFDVFDDFIALENAKSEQKFRRMVKLRKLIKSRLRLGSTFQPQRSLGFLFSNAMNFTVTDIDERSLDFCGVLFDKNQTVIKKLIFRVLNVGGSTWTTQRRFSFCRNIVYRIDLKCPMELVRKRIFLLGLKDPNSVIYKILRRGDVKNIFKLIFSFCDSICF